MLLFLWQTPEDPSSTTHHLTAPPSSRAQNPLPLSHVSNLHYLQVQEGDSDGSLPNWKVVPSNYGVPPAYSAVDRDPSDVPQAHSGEASLAEVVGVERGSASATHALATGGVSTTSMGQQVNQAQQHPIRHLGSGYIHEVIRKTLKSPVKMRLRHKESKRHERRGSSTYNNEEGGDYKDEEWDSGIYSRSNALDDGNEKTRDLVADHMYSDKPFKNDIQSNGDSSKRKERDDIKENNDDSSEMDEYSEEDEYTGSRYNVTPNALLLVYNRIPKCASSTMQTILRRLSRHLGYEHVSSLIYNQHQLSQDDQEELVDNLTTSAKAAPSTALSYDRHLYYTNFTLLGMDRPVYINIIRDPVERFISSFYYRRSEERLSRIQARGHPVSPSPSWVNRTVEQCVFYNDPECTFIPGEEKEMILTYFCGHHNFCRIVGHQGALQIAKQVVSEEYSVVGLLDHMDTSLLLMETLVPRFLTGALKVYLNIKQREHVIVNKNQKKPEVPMAVREELRQRMADDTDFYNFLEQRLFEQKQNFLSEQKYH